MGGRAREVRRNWRVAFSVSRGSWEVARNREIATRECVPSGIRRESKTPRARSFWATSMHCRKATARLSLGGEEGRAEVRNDGMGIVIEFGGAGGAEGDEEGSDSESESESVPINETSRERACDTASGLLSDGEGEEEARSSWVAKARKAERMAWASGVGGFEKNQEDELLESRGGSEGRRLRENLESVVIV